MMGGRGRRVFSSFSKGLGSVVVFPVSVVVDGAVLLELFLDDGDDDVVVFPV